MAYGRVCSLVLVMGALASCSAGNAGNPFGDQTIDAAAGSGGGGAEDSGTYVDPDSGYIDPGDSGGGGDTCAAAAKLVYLVSSADVGQGDLYSYAPDTNGLAAYKKIGTLKCDSSSSPQSMSVDRSGLAYVFYSNGKLFKVSTENASCTPTSYKHFESCSLGCMLGMGFTAPTANSSEQLLYVQSATYGLATIDLVSLKYTKRASLKNNAELTGGGDGRLFMFDADKASILEVDQSSYATTELKKVSLSNVQAFAFSRYHGNFHIFTASSTSNTKTTVWDPSTDKTTTRDANIGFRVVGAGQSTCVQQVVPK